MKKKESFQPKLNILGYGTYNYSDWVVGMNGDRAEIYVEAMFLPDKLKDNSPIEITGRTQCFWNKEDDKNYFCAVYEDERKNDYAFLKWAAYELIDYLWYCSRQIERMEDCDHE